MENIKEFFSGIRWDYIVITSFFVLMLVVSLAGTGINFWPWHSKKGE